MTPLAKPAGVPPPPRWLDRKGRAAWRAAAPKVGRAVNWRLDGPLFARFCASWPVYRSLVAKARAARGRSRQAWARQRDDWRMMLRRLAAGFLLIPADRVALAPLNPQGLDADLARIFTPGEPPCPASRRGRRPGP